MTTIHHPYETASQEFPEPGPTGDISTAAIPLGEQGAPEAVEFVDSTEAAPAPVLAVTAAETDVPERVITPAKEHESHKLRNGLIAGGLAVVAVVSIAFGVEKSSANKPTRPQPVATAPATPGPNASQSAPNTAPSTSDAEQHVFTDQEGVQTQLIPEALLSTDTTYTVQDGDVTFELPVTRDPNKTTPALSAASFLQQFEAYMKVNDDAAAKIIEDKLTNSQDVQFLLQGLRKDSQDYKTQNGYQAQILSFMQNKTQTTQYEVDGTDPFGNPVVELQIGDNYPELKVGYFWNDKTDKRFGIAEGDKVVRIFTFGVNPVSHKITSLELGFGPAYS